eukprot:scaffold190503_cov26-Tisochrysis_lutea.AAC.6
MRSAPRRCRSPSERAERRAPEVAATGGGSASRVRATTRIGRGATQLCTCAWTRSCSTAPERKVSHAQSIGYATCGAHMARVRRTAGLPCAAHRGARGSLV